jgi:hypothetical protein
MKDSKIQIKNISLGVKTKLSFVRIMVYQFRSNFQLDWGKDKIHELIFPRRINKFRDAIQKALIKAEEKKVDLLVFPELSVPEELIVEIEKWSTGKDIIVVAGSHYKYSKQNEKPISVSPIIYNGSVKGFTQKIESAYLEKGFIPEGGIQEGNTINIYRESPIGDFAVMICSDNLDEAEQVKGIIKKEELDFWIIPAFQKNSNHHFKRMTVDVESSNSRYIIYCNNYNEFSDGKSSFFGETDNNIIEGLIDNKYTDNLPEWKLISLFEPYDFFIIKVDIKHKRNMKPKVVKDDPNIEVLEIGTLINQHKGKCQQFALGKKESIQKSIEKKSSGKKSIDLTLQNMNKGDFNIFSIERYNILIDKFKIISENPNDFQDLMDPILIKNIKQSLDEKGIAFIIAPIRFGKSYLLKYIQYKFSDFIFITDIDGELLSVKRNEIKSIFDLYFVWFKSIAESILAKKGLAKLSLNKLNYGVIENKGRFIDWLNIRKSFDESNMQGLIRCLAEFKAELEYHQDVLISFHLDDIHKYVDDNIFKMLKDDLVKFKNDFNNKNKLTVKLLIASRYFPSSALKKMTVNIIPYFDLTPIYFLINYFINEMSETIKFTLSQLILNKTDGYPWFVLRFFRIYLEKRSKGDPSHPILLAKDIFSNKLYWTTDYILGEKKESEYLEELIRLVKDSDYTMKENFKIFIQTKSDPISLNNGWNNDNDFLIRQSGFLKIDQKADSFINNGSYIMRNYFQEIIEEYL